MESAFKKPNYVKIRGVPFSLMWMTGISRHTIAGIPRLLHTHCIIPYMDGQTACIATKVATLT